MTGSTGSWPRQTDGEIKSVVHITTLSYGCEWSDVPELERRHRAGRHCKSYQRRVLRGLRELN